MDVAVNIKPVAVVVGIQGGTQLCSSLIESKSTTASLFSLAY